MSVATAVYEQTCHVCDALRLFVMRTFINIQRGRQLSASSAALFTTVASLPLDARSAREAVSGGVRCPSQLLTKICNAVKIEEWVKSRGLKGCHHCTKT